MEGQLTKKLFYEDSHRKEFEAVVLSCVPDGGDYKAVLDRTAFFPEGGGQYADRGWLNKARVLDVHEKEGVIYHKTDKALEQGSTVTGRIDWEERFSKMQQHTGEHIVSGLINSRFGYSNVGFHLGSDYCTLDFNGIITKGELNEIELEANRAVVKNLDICVAYPGKEELAGMEYRSKIEIEGQVRIVTVPGYDVCACCAPHVKKTGEIGIIKLVNMINYKGGVRITMLCGFRALEDYSIKLENVKSIGALLCEKEDQTARAVSRLYSEKADLKARNATLQQQILAYRADEIPIHEKITAVFDPALTGNGPREFMNLILEKGAEICAVFAGTDTDGYRYVIGSRTKDVRPIGKELNIRLNARGGGKPEMIQGSVSAERKAIEEIFGGINEM